MGPRLLAVALVLSALLVPAGMAVASGDSSGQVTPLYIPCECTLLPSLQYISSADLTATFDGQWGGGVGRYYSVHISYGDGSSESLPGTTTLTCYTFVHKYPSSGGPWTATLTVTNGNTAQDTAQVIRR